MELNKKTMNTPLNNHQSSANNGSNTEGRERASTFSRAFTFEAGGFSRASTQFGRTFTDTLGLTYDTEEQWTKSLLANYAQVAEKGVDGDMPPPEGFGREQRSWRFRFEHS